MPELDLAEVVDVDRHARVGRDDDVADIGQAGQPAETAHVVELATELVEPTACVLVVVRERGDDVRDREVIGVERVGIEHDLVLPGRAAEPRVVRDPRDRLVAPEQHPVLDDLELLR